MKKIIQILLVLSSIIAISMFFGCEMPTPSVEIEKEILSTPTNLVINDYDILTWDSVQYASSYVINIKTSVEEKEYISDVNRLDLLEITNVPERYKITVKARSDSDRYEESSFSNEYSYRIYDSSKYFEFRYNSLSNIYYATLKDKSIKGKIIAPTTTPDGFPVSSLQNINNCSESFCLYVPDSITHIGTLENCSNLKRVRLSNNLERVPGFESCNKIQEINIPSSITHLSRWTFNNCLSLQKIVIGKEMNDIAGSVIISCGQLKEIIIDEDNPKYYSENAYIIDKETKTIICGNYKNEMPSSAEAIGEYAFESSDIAEFIVPKQIKVIKDRAFHNCKNLRKVTLEEGVCELSEGVFTSSGLLEINIPKSLTYIDPGTFSFCRELRKIKVDVNNERYRIEDNCLIDLNEKILLYALEDPIAPQYVESIAPYAFINSKVISINLPESLQSIGRGAFIETGIEEVIANSELRIIEESAFSKCNSLKTFVCNDKLENISDTSFYNCTNLVSFTFPDSLKNIGARAFYNCSLLSDLSFGNQLETIGDQAFENCFGVTSIHLSDSIKNIGVRAFNGCFKIQSLFLPKNLESIGSGAFGAMYCSTLLKKGFKEINVIQSQSNSFSSFPSFMVYTDASYDDEQVLAFVNKYLTDGHMYILTNCTFVDEYIYSFKYYNFEEILDEETKIQRTSYHDSYKNLSHHDFLLAPYRDGYKFLGFSLDENSNTLAIVPTTRNTTHIVDYIGSSVTYDYTLTFFEDIGNFLKTLENGTVLYSVWEKI